MHIRLFEMTYRRKEIKASIDDQLSQLVQNWCLCWIAAHSPDIAVQRRFAHWADELGDQMDPGFAKFDARGLDAKARERIVKEVFLGDAHLDTESRVITRVLRKITVKEHLTYEECHNAVLAWLAYGLREVMDAYIHDDTSIPYIQRVMRDAPDV